MPQCLQESMLMMTRFLCTAAAAICTQIQSSVYRHGDRSSETSYPKDPHKNIWPQGLGWLTTVGMNQQYALGQFLRSEYDGFLNTTYKNTEIAVEASNVNRCLMSAYSNLAGLYPPHDDQIWNANLLWQPIPVHAVPEIQDNKLALDKPCVRYDEVFAEELRSPAIREEERVNADFYKYIDEQTGIKRENISEIWKIADVLFCENAHNFTLPEWATKMWKNRTVYDKMQALKAWSFDLLYHGQILSRLKGGPLLKEFIQNMQGVAADPTGDHLKMHMYSAHDVTVAAVAGAMRVFDGLPPPYATALLVELHEMDSKYCVKIRYRNETTRPPFTLVHPLCNQECCPLDTFVAATKDRVPVDWENECGNKHGIPSSDGFFDNATVVAFVCLFLVALLLFLLVLYGYLRQRRIVKTFQMF